MPLLMIVVGLTAHQAVGTSLGIVVFGSVAGTIKHGLAGNVSLVVAMALLVGSSLGVQAGVAVCQRWRARRLRRAFALLALLVAMWLMWGFLRQILGVLSA